MATARMSEKTAATRLIMEGYSQHGGYASDRRPHGYEACGEKPDHVPLTNLALQTKLTSEGAAHCSKVSMHALEQGLVSSCCAMIALVELASSSTWDS